MVMMVVMVVALAVGALPIYQFVVHITAYI